MRFNGYLNSQFSGCTLLGTARDECRGRDVKVFMLPETEDLVGIFDGVDSFVAPSVGNPYGINIRAAIHAAKSGAPVRRRISTLKEAAPAARRRINLEATTAPPQKRKRFNI